MKHSWYKNIMPKISQVKSELDNIANNIQKIPSVNEVRVWGSFLKNIRNNDFALSDLDIIAVVDIFSEDLVSIMDDAPENLFKMTETELEDSGYDPQSVIFTYKYSQIDTFDIDHWAISKDKKLLHLGPITTDKKEWEEIKKEAESYANRCTGVRRFNLKSEGQKLDWYNNYKQHFSQHLEQMPHGWYISDQEVSEVLKESNII